MLTIDAQVHAYERNHPGRPWAAVLHGPAEVTGDDMVKAMDAVGVDGALLVSPFTMYRYDASYALDVRAAAPRPVRGDQAGRSERSQGGRYDRRMGGHRGHRRHPHHDDARAFRPTPPIPASTACWRPPPGIPFRSTCCAGAGWSRSASWRRAIPSTRLVIDHLGLQQPFEPPAPAEPWAELPKLLALAAHDNIVVKISGACTLVAPAVSLQGHLGSARPHLRCLRLRSLHVGHRLDAGGRLADLQAGSRGVPRHRPPVRQRPGRAMGQTLQKVYDWAPAKAGSASG